MMSAQDLLRIHPSPVEEEPSADYSLTINGQPVFVYKARVSAGPVNQVWPGYQRPLDQTEIASFAVWEMAEPVEVSVACARPVNEVRVRPSSRGIKPMVEGNVIRFSIERPGQFTAEVNGTHQALHLFANPLEEVAPDANNPSVRYFGPGVHCPGLIRLENNQSVHIAGGAVVYGAVIAEGAENVAISGRGILDGSKFDRMDVNSLVFFFDCKNIRVEGITLRDPNAWTIVPVACEHVEISNVKLIGNWRYNSDGIDLINCSHCSVEDSFIRAFDDCIALKGYENWGPFIYPLQLLDGKFDGRFTMDGITSHTFYDFQKRLGIYRCPPALRDIQVRRCVIWNDWGRALEVGAETVATEMSGFLFEDCDIIHATHVAMDVQNTDHALCKDIEFRNIRVEFDDDFTRTDPRLIVLENVRGYVSIGPERGRIEDIVFKDIDVTAPSWVASALKGFDSDHLVQRVFIENLRVNGEAVTNLNAGSFCVNEFVSDVSMSARAARMKVDRILILGNSITTHDGLEGSGWPGKDWGMAASAADKDYVHLLLKRFAEAAGGKPPEAKVVNIADFERDYDSFDIAAALKSCADFQADVVILAISENVPELSSEESRRLYHDALTRLVALLLKDNSSSLFIRSSFWPDGTKDDILRQVCAEAGGTYVDISLLSEDESMYARSERPFKNSDVAKHPGDRGMASIAEAIWSAVRKRL